MKRDILSEVLRSVSLSGAVFFDVAASSPWVAEAPASAALLPLVMPNAQHLIEYHVVTSGFGWATLIDAQEEPIRLAPGSVIMFPRGDPHALSSRPHMRAAPDIGLFDQPAERSPPFYIEQFGGGPETTRLICGFLGCDLLPFNPVIQALPRMVHVPEGYTVGDGWLGSLIQAIMKESRRQRPGVDNVLARLSELLFIEVVRSHMEALPDDASGWLAALADPLVGRIIRLLHENPQRPWTLDTLAREAAVSRTVLVSRFTARVGVAPMTYLCHWRMQMAAGRLTRGGAGIAQIAADVGYEPEAAFSRAFKRSTGLAPGAWRSRQAAGRDKG
ncbi:AraC family transcriptional regulator [Billgrantia azerbaijanica]|nr:AraC family transcriptional regulator [Halomonas azerbaijanica]